MDASATVFIPSAAFPADFAASSLLSAKYSISIVTPAIAAPIPVLISKPRIAIFSVVAPIAPPVNAACNTRVVAVTAIAALRYRYIPAAANLLLTVNDINAAPSSLIAAAALVALAASIVTLAAADK